MLRGAMAEIRKLEYKGRGDAMLGLIPTSNKYKHVAVVYQQNMRGMRSLWGVTGRHTPLHARLGRV